MKNIYLACIHTENGKNYAYMVRVPVGVNILAHLERHKIEVAHTCSTKKEARDLVNIWNACYKANGTYLFNDAPAF